MKTHYLAAMAEAEGNVSMDPAQNGNPHIYQENTTCLA
jgi:hypothetical protein